MGAALTRLGRINLLNNAYEQGVMHYDTAPLYGLGKAQSLLGHFLKGKRSNVTITTKFGLTPPTIPFYYHWAIPFGRYLNRHSRIFNQVIKSRLSANQSAKTESDSSSTPQSVSANDNSTKHYELDKLKNSLHSSLKQLDTDYIDIFLLHECQLANLNDEIVYSLQGFVESGKILSYGLATGKSQSLQILDHYPQLNKIVQVPNTIINTDLDTIVNTDHTLVITHSTFALVWKRVTDYLNADQSHLARWSNQIDYDLSADTSVSQLLLAHALNENNQGVVLFSSANKKNISANTEVANGISLSTQQIEEFKSMVIDEVFSN